MLETLVFGCGLAALILAIVLLAQSGVKALAGWAILVLALAIILLSGCDPEAALVGPAPDPEAPPTARVVVSPDGADSLVVSDQVVLLRPGLTATVGLHLIATAAGAHDIVLAQADTTAAVLRARPIHYHRGGLQPADFVGRVLSDATVVVVSDFAFDTPGSFRWAVPIEGRAVGKALIHGFWLAADGEELGRFQIEARVQ